MSDEEDNNAPNLHEDLEEPLEAPLPQVVAEVVPADAVVQVEQVEQQVQAPPMGPGGDGPNFQIDMNVPIAQVNFWSILGVIHVPSRSVPTPHPLSILPFLPYPES